MILLILLIWMCMPLPKGYFVPILITILFLYDKAKHK